MYRKINLKLDLIIRLYNLNANFMDYERQYPKKLDINFITDDKGSKQISKLIRANINQQH